MAIYMELKFKIEQTERHLSNLREQLETLAWVPEVKMALRNSLVKATNDEVEKIIDWLIKKREREANEE